MHYNDRQLTIDDLEKPLIQSLNESIRELRDDLYDHHRETTRRLTSLEGSMTEGGKELSEVKVSVGVLSREMTAMKTEVKELHQDVSELRGDVKAIDARLNAFETKMG